LSALTARRFALITCFAMVMSLPIPLWTATQTMLGIEARNSRVWWTVPPIVLAFLITPILPVFYFAFSCHEGTLRLPKRLRLLSFAGALAGGMVVAAALPLWLEPFRPYPTTIKMLLSEFADLACILLLIALFRQSTDTPAIDIPASRLLRMATTAAVIEGGVLLGFDLLALALTPWNYAHLRDSVRPGTAMPPHAEADMIAGAIRTLLDQICLFTAPWIVWRTVFP
jgi:hypothetical protein